MSKQKLIKRLKHYYPLEKFHAFVSFPALFVFLVYNYSFQESFFLLYGVLICIVILIQGQHYWKLKLYKLTNKPFDQEKNINYFKKSKKINWILIGLIPIILFIQLFQNNWEVTHKFIVGVLLNLFAILEHINYYYRQLTIDKLSDLKYLIRNKKLKIASLAKDLKEDEL